MTDDAQARYETDPVFRSVVDMLHSVIRQAQLSPSEVRQAAMLAAIRYEMYDPRPQRFWIERGIPPSLLVEVQTAAADAALEVLRGPYAP